MKHLSQVRHLRKRFSLTQAELAELLGSHQANVSRIECGDTVPDFDTAYGLQLLFGRGLHELFPSAVSRIEDGIMRRAAALSITSDFDTNTKRGLLEGLAKRAHICRSDI